MHIVRSDKNADTTVVTLAEMRAEMIQIGTYYDDEVTAVELVTILLFNYEGTIASDNNEIALVCGDLTFTIREAPYLGKPADYTPPPINPPVGPAPSPRGGLVR